MTAMISHKNTRYNQKSELDQFYTTSDIAKLCVDKITKLYDIDAIDLFVEPSAGTGSFLKLFPIKNRIGLDIDPKNDEINKLDFFDFVAPEDKKYIAVIGNPPFGRICSLAVRFFNHAAKFANIIAFIIPRTFRKVSLQNRLDLSFRLVADIDLPKNSFILNDEPYNVPCCFQVWEKSNKKRIIKKLSLDNKLFEFVTKDKANIAVRRVGGRTGKATSDIVNSSETSHYFLKLKNKKLSVIKFINLLNKINYSRIVDATAGVKSLSKPEFLLKLKKTRLIKNLL